MKYYEVAPTKIVRDQTHVLTYSSEASLDIGTIVTIPVRNTTLTGVIMHATTKPSYAVKPVERIIDLTPLPLPLLETATWMSAYYNTHLALVWQTILPAGLTKKRRKAASATPVHARNRTKKVFTHDQEKALQTIAETTEGTILLHGITGSGKTLVYIEAAREAIKTGASVIILVPEIALTSQLVSEFAQHFNDIVLTHSRQTETERHRAWQQVLHAVTPQVIIGPRSALFLPVKKLGLIVIDECHEPSFKQEQSPRYSALRVASILARAHHTKALFGSATPAVADYFLATQSKRPIIAMLTPARHDTSPPTVQLIDMTARDNFKEHPFLSDQLFTALRQTFAQGKQALIFHNRRGTASTTLCHNCGWQAGCPRCFIPLTLHADHHQLRCHICGMHARVPTSCPECHAADITHKGIGTKKIEDALRRLFPDKTIARFDADTAADKTVDQAYGTLYDGSIDLIIGTQVIAKGLDLPHLRTVGIIQADAGLSLPDFIAPERTFQLLAQVIGRVGRSHHATTVIVQSYQPQHPAVQNGITQNYQDFYTRTIAGRKQSNFPPFCYLLKATCIYKTEQTAVRNARNVAEVLRRHASSDVHILGPTPAFYERIHDTYRWQLIIKSTSRQHLIDLLQHIPRTHWQFELDPVSLL